jgi:DNA-binding NtrC family response regulator
MAERKKRAAAKKKAEEPKDAWSEPEIDAGDEAAGIGPFRPRILIVDDEKPITDTLTRYFTLEGYDVLATNNPFSALQIIHRENILVVISDIAMPGMSGVELLRRTKRYNGMIQVIMITGYVTLDNILSCLRLGADDCFIKPLADLTVLRGAVDEALRRLRKWHDLMLEIVKGR